MREKYNPVTWFEIPAADLERARTFYQNVFQWEMPLADMTGMKMAYFPMEEQSPNASGVLMEADSYVPSHEGTMVYFRVKDINATLKRVVKSGGKILNPKKSIGEYGFVGHFEDSEGNRVALHSNQ